MLTQQAPVASAVAEKCNGLWRSEDMTCIQVIAQRDVLHDTVSGVGRLGKCEFLDLNADAHPFARPFTEEARVCDGLLRKLLLIESHIESDVSGLADALDDNYCASVEEVWGSTQDMCMVEERIDETLTNLDALASNLKSFRREMNQERELFLLYRTVDQMNHSDGPDAAQVVSPSTWQNDGAAAGSFHEALRRLYSVVGSISTANTENLRRLCYRVTRGNAVVLISEQHLFFDLENGELKVGRCLFSVFCASNVMIRHLQKLIGTLDATLYSLDEVCAHVQTAAESTDTSETTHFDNCLTVLESSLRQAAMYSGQQKSELLSQWYPQHRVYKRYLLIERSVLSMMNRCSISGGSTATIVVWVPTKYIPSLESVVKEASATGDVRSVMTMHFSQRNPPTYFETNWFTSQFQGIVDSYGMARYKEVNPGVFTIITFPYLFGMMYGDIGHGMLLLGVSLFLIIKGRHWNEDALNEMIQLLYGGRYLLLLMSLFAIYMGMLYNDFMGFSLNLFSSSYTWGPSGISETTQIPSMPNGSPSVKPKSPVAFGLDAAWAETENKLEFYNSVKMKSAVIVGVVQMVVGLLLSLDNYVYHKQWTLIYFRFIPEFVFLLNTFGYMSLLIIIKWCTTWENTHDAPSLLEVMTNFFLQPGSLSHPLFAGQAAIQVLLLVIAFLMVPILLCGSPITEYRRYTRWRERRMIANVAVVNHEGNSEDGDHFSAPLPAEEDSEDEDFEDFDLSEMIIHSVIHTIEYVLSTVSNTASYLRLWALSLAHAQLSEVFFNFAIVKVLDADDSGIGIAIGAFLWLMATVVVLVGMEALSSFLHALRLHWVEFQNKFYLGDGRPFAPYNVQTV